jgi:hypothetical protein
MLKEAFGMDFYQNLKEVRIIDSEDARYNGKIGRVIDVQEHKFGIDLRVMMPTGEAFWISTDSVEEIQEMFV